VHLLSDYTLSNLKPVYDIPASCCKKETQSDVCEVTRKLGITAKINPVMNSEVSLFLRSMIKGLKRDYNFYTFFILHIKINASGQGFNYISFPGLCRKANQGLQEEFADHLCCRRRHYWSRVYWLDVLTIIVLCHSAT
jgi:hypothetical protein